MFGNKSKKCFTIAFYNVENFFDTKKDPQKNDGDFTPDGRLQWDQEKYNLKLERISSVLKSIGKSVSQHRPALIGLAEIENRQVLEDLIGHPNLYQYRYGYLHFESEDARGIDVALLYRKDVFKVLEVTPYDLDNEKEAVDFIYGRDVLVVKGLLYGEEVHVVVNHWPSRRGGNGRSGYKRIELANFVSDLLLDITRKSEESPAFIIMGDFNDNPSDTSIAKVLMNENLYNPMRKLHDKGLGTLTHEGEWHLFDQIIISKSLIKGTKHIKFKKAHIFKKPWLEIDSGKYKGSPFRSYIGPWYEGGYSDHFPVFVEMRAKKTLYL